MGGETEGRTVLRLAAVDVRVVARDDEHHVRRLRDPGHRVLAALGNHQLEDVRALFGNLHAVGGDRDVATRTDVLQEVTVLMGFQAECLLDDPASGLVGGGADVAVVGDREVTAVRGAQGEDALAPVHEGEFGAGRVGGERGQVGASGEQGRVQRALGAAYFVLRVRQRNAQEGALEGPQQDPVHSLRELDALGAEPLVQTLQWSGPVDQRAAVPVEFALVREQTDHGETGVVGQRQQVVVLEEDHRLFRGLLGEGPVRRGVEVLGAGVRVVVRVELAEPEPDRELTADRRVDIGLGQQALVQRPLDPGRDRRTVGAVIGEAVHTGQQRGRRRLLVGVEVVLRVDQVEGAPASEQTKRSSSVQVRNCSRRYGDTWLGRPLTRLYAGITPATAPASTVSRKARRSYSCSTRGRTEDDEMSRPVSLLCASQCLRTGAVRQYVGWSPRRPRVYAVAIAEVSFGSSE